MIDYIKSFLQSIYEVDKDKIPEENNYPPYVRSYIFAKFISINSTFVHALFLILFLLLSVKILAIFNIFSVIVWVISFVLFRKWHFWKGFIIIAIEMIVHAFLCVVVIGWDAGFQYYIFITPSLIFLTHWKTYLKVLNAIVFILAYMAMAQYASVSHPYIALSPFALAALNYMNIFYAIVTPIIASYGYYNATLKVEKELEKEHQKTNNLLSHLNSELTEAAEYVKTILPQPIANDFVKIDWRFIPSTSLGGDAFGYHTIDDDHYAIYIIDVSGHGVGAALLSVSVINFHFFAAFVFSSHGLTSTN